MSEERAKRHHLTPVSYLLRFADEHDRILVHDKRDGHEFITSVRNIEVETDFYTVPGEDGSPSDAFEKFIAREIEGPAVSSLSALALDWFPPSDADRTLIARFMALQYCRGRAFRDMHARTASVTATRPIATHPELTDDENERLRREAPPEFLRMANAAGFRMDLILQMTDRVFAEFGARPWTLVRTSDAPTSDVAVAPWDRTSGIAGFGIGLGIATEISMAITPERVLVLGPRAERQLENLVVDAQDTWRRQFPEFVRAAAQRYLYRRPGTVLSS